MIKPSDLTAEQVRNWLIYDRKTGHFYWRRNKRAGGWWEGKRAGSTTKLGYVLIGIDYRQYPAQHLAWLYVTGQWSPVEIDHKDVNSSNNAFDNLRPATSREQKWNKRVQSNNISGLKGAYYHACHKGKKWRSQINVNGKLIFLGYFHTAQEAHEAYGRSAIEHFGEFARVT
jgi:hypothetical protein